MLVDNKNRYKSVQLIESMQVNIELLLRPVYTFTANLTNFNGIVILTLFEI